MQHRCDYPTILLLKLSQAIIAIYNTFIFGVEMYYIYELNILITKYGCYEILVADYPYQRSIHITAFPGNIYNMYYGIIIMWMTTMVLATMVSVVVIIIAIYRSDWYIAYILNTLFNLILVIMVFILIIISLVKCNQLSEEDVSLWNSVDEKFMIYLSAPKAYAYWFIGPMIIWFMIIVYAISKLVYSCCRLY